MARWIRPKKRLAIYLRDGFRCVYCGQNLAKTLDPKLVTLDHIKTRICGGNNEVHNLITSCRKCNSCRGSTKIRKWAKASTLKTIHRQTRKNMSKYLRLARKILRNREKENV